MKVVINDGIGGFGLSEKAILKLIEYGIPVYTPEQLEDPEKWDPPTGRIHDFGDDEILGRYYPYFNDEARAHPLLVRVVEEMGDKANSKHSTLKIVEVPDDVEWTIWESEEGYESIHEKHRVWR